MIYTHCIRCGTALPDDVTSYGGIRYVAAATIILLAILLVICLVVPALHLSAATGRNLSEAINTGAAGKPLSLYALNEPARSGDLQVTVTQVRKGDHTLNAGRFLIVTVSIRNFAGSTGYRIPAGDFVLADKKGTYYTTTGIGSKVSYDAGAGTSGTADLIYIVSQTAEDLRLHYTFPVSAGTGVGRQEVIFTL